ncbi:MAG: ABC transporter substrate-binding protein [Thermodesulfobacteriota bacterium]|nr:ABC transporter substrate-binding protein [Thermodesulfobacteriota bacterium]
MYKERRLAGIFLICFFFVILSFSLSSNASGEEARGVKKDVVKIGVILDLTGPTSNAGVILIEAYKNFIRYVNDTGGIHGRKIKFVVEDDHYSMPAGIAAFKKLLFKDQVLAILGPVSVGETRALFRHIERHKIPTLPWAPDRSVRDPYKRYVFPTNGYYANELGVLFHYILNDLKVVNPKMAFCYPDVESGKLLKDWAEDWAGFFGLKLHLEIIPLSAIDVTSQVLSMKRAGVTHAILGHVAPGVVAMLKDMKKFGLKIPSFGLSAGCTEDVIRIGGTVTDGFVAPSEYSSWYEESPGMAKMRKISTKYNPDADKSYRIKSYSLGWVIPLIFCEGMKRAGKELDGEKLVSALETMQDFDTQGICGPINYTPTMHYGLSYNRLFRADPKRNQLVPITDWRLPPERK